MRTSKRTLRRLENSDRQRLIRAHIVHPHNDDLEARKRIEKMWERSMDILQSTHDHPTSSQQE